MYEINDYNSTIYYCDDCRKACFQSELKNFATAEFRIRKCTFCNKVKLVNVYNSKSRIILLDESGRAKETYVEREGV